MLELMNLLRGILVGAVVAAPLGPIGVLCIQRTIVRGRIAGIVSGMGAATADAIYAALAVSGLMSLHATWLVDATWPRVFATIVLLVVGVIVFLTPPPKGITCQEQRRLSGVYISTLLLTLTNPIPLLSFGGFFETLGVRGVSLQRFSAHVMILGVFVGSALWFAGLSALVDALRDRLTPRLIRAFNQICGLIVVAIAICGLFR